MDTGYLDREMQVKPGDIVLNDKFGIGLVIKAYPLEAGVHEIPVTRVLFGSGMRTMLAKGLKKIEV